MWLCAVGVPKLFVRRQAQAPSGAVVVRSLCTLFLLFTLSPLSLFSPAISHAAESCSRGFLDARQELHGYSLKRSGEEYERVSRIVNTLQRKAGIPPVGVAIAVGGRAVNALALETREIVVYQELLRRIRDEDELAAVLAHELAHLDHGAERLSAALTQTVRGFAAPGGNSVRTELAADLVGMQLMAQAGYDPRAAIGLWERARDIFPAPPVASPVASPVNASTHPSFAQRRNALLQSLPAALREYRRQQGGSTREAAK